MEIHPDKGNLHLRGNLYGTDTVLLIEVVLWSISAVDADGKEMSMMQDLNLTIVLAGC